MSAAVLFDITEAWTSPLDAQLLINGVAFDATGMSIASIIKDRTGTTVAVTTSWQTQASAVARLAPASNSFIAANEPYSVRFQVTDGAGKVAFYPQGDAAQISVHKQ